MKILFFYRDIGNGGVQKNMLRLAEGLSARGHSIDFVITHAETDEFAIPDGVRLQRSIAGHPLHMVWDLARRIDQLQPDAVYTAMPNYNAVALLARLMARHKPKIIISERSHSGAEWRHARSALYRLSLVLAPLLYRLADRILAVSAATADSLTQTSAIARERITVLHNPVVNAALDRAAAEPLEHEWLAAPHELIVAVGRLSRQKDYPTLLTAFSQVLRARPTARLVVLGEGEERATLLALSGELGLTEAVQWLGFEANPYRWMARANVFVLTSLWEGLPTVVIEALACGATMVVTDSLSGPRHIIGESGQLGYLAPVADSVAIAQKLLFALDNPLEPSALRAEARHYSTEAAVFKFEAILRDVLSARAE